MLNPAEDFLIVFVFLNIFSDQTRSIFHLIMTTINLL